MVLRRTVNPFLNGNTGGSNPSPPTNFADVAQLVERTLHTGMVTGSSPVFGTISLPWYSWCVRASEEREDSVRFREAAP